MQTIETRDNHLGKKLEKLEEIVHEYKGDEIKKKDEIRRYFRFFLSEFCLNILLISQNGPKIDRNSQNRRKNSPTSARIHRMSGKAILQWTNFGK